MRYVDLEWILDIITIGVMQKNPIFYEKIGMRVFLFYTIFGCRKFLNFIGTRKTRRNTW